MSLRLSGTPGKRLALAREQPYSRDMRVPRKRRPVSGGVSPAQAKSWAKAWKRAGMRLETLRRRRLEMLGPRDVQAAMRRLDGAFRSLLRQRRSRKTSGLVELAAWLKRLRA
jgi:hypothetical protein